MGGIIAVSVISTLIAMFILDPGLSPVVSAPSPSSNPSANQIVRPPDLSTMTPREAADRLFNRVMSANERGNLEEARRFAPMAIQAYNSVGNLDADGLFHLGLIHLVLDDYKNAKIQAQRILSLAPDHLLAIFLEYKVASLTNDKLKQEQVATHFKGALKKEAMNDRPEYSAHRNSIQSMRRELKLSIKDVLPMTAKVSGSRGQEIFIKNCSICHGINARGTKKGPPLIHKIYEPSHHDNASFYRAVQNGVQQHHWSFGKMPPVAGVPRQDVSQIISYVRAVQVANGIR